MKISKSLIALLSVLVLSSVLSARGNMNPSTFQDFDLDNDGTISEQEFDARRVANMTKRAEEGMPMRNVGNAPVFSDLDTNNDGKIDSVEYSKGKAMQMQNKGKNKGQGKNYKN